MTDTRVLVIDDEKFFRESVREALVDASISCEEAEGDEDALTRALEPDVGVAVLDVGLAGMGAVEWLRRVRAERPAVQVIVIAADTDQEVVLDALRAGACDYLAKPLHDEELVLAVRRAVEGFEVRAESARLGQRTAALEADLAEALEAAAAVELPDTPLGDAAVRDAELVRSICDVLTAEFEPGRLVGETLRTIGEGIPAAPVSLYLLDGASGALVREGSFEIGDDDRERLPANRGFTGMVASTGRMVATDAPAADPRFDAAVDTPEGGRASSLLCVPVRVRGKILGVLRLFPRDGAVASARTGEILTSAISAAVRNVLMYRSLLESVDEVARARRERAGAAAESVARPSA